MHITSGIRIQEVRTDMNNAAQKGSSVLKILTLALAAIIVILIVFYGSLPESYDYRPGSVASTDIYAPRNFIDSYETEQQAIIARNSVTAIFIRSEELSEQNVDRVVAFFDLAQQERSLLVVTSPGSPAPITAEAAADQLSVNLSQTFGASVSAEDLLVFMTMSDSSFSYVRDKAISIAELIMVDDINESALESAIDLQIDSFKETNPSYSTYADSLQIVFKQILQPNSVFDEKATNDQAENAYLAVISEPVTVEKGSRIVSSGDVITEHQYQNLIDLELIRDSTFNFVFLLRDICYVAVIALCAFVYFRVMHKNDYFGQRIFYMMVLTFLIPLGISLYASSFGFNFCAVLFFTAICASYLGTFDSIVFSIVNLLFSWPVFSFDIDLLFINMVGIIVCASIAGRKDKVSSSATIILFPSLGCLLAALAFGFLNGYTQDQYISAVSFALVSSTAALIASIGVTPIYELITNNASPIKLIALSQPGQHLLKRLFLEASGTYQHSLMVSNLADAAAEAVGADSLLCKVAAYYHDIGKLENPQYFTENQHGGVNPHDNLPIMESVAIITAHPENGVKIAKKEHLPQAIINIIDEHHGTTYPGYFYFKACEEAKAKGLEQPDVNNFRYKGHIPSSRESAIIMMADTCEAAVRSTKQNDPAGVEALIRKLIRDKIEQDQLINSGLSFDDIEKIIIAFKQVYSGVFHERIKYPDENKNS